MSSYTLAVALTCAMQRLEAKLREPTTYSYHNDECDEHGSNKHEVVYIA